MLSRTGSGRPVRGAGKGAALARVAGQLCNCTSFQQWVTTRVGAVPKGVTAQQHAAQYIRDICGVTSRAHLDVKPEAAALFHEAVRKPYLKARGIYG